MNVMLRVSFGNCRQQRRQQQHHRQAVSKTQHVGHQSAISKGFGMQCMMNDLLDAAKACQLAGQQL
jgi:hypothetical protein